MIEEWLSKALENFVDGGVHLATSVLEASPAYALNKSLGMWKLGVESYLAVAHELAHALVFGLGAALAGRDGRVAENLPKIASADLPEPVKPVVERVARRVAPRVPVTPAPSRPVRDSAREVVRSTRSLIRRTRVSRPAPGNVKIFLRRTSSSGSSASKTAPERSRDGSRRGVERAVRRAAQSTSKTLDVVRRVVAEAPTGRTTLTLPASATAPPPPPPTPPVPEVPIRIEGVTPLHARRMARRVADVATELHSGVKEVVERVTEAAPVTPRRSRAIAREFRSVSENVSELRREAEMPRLKLAPLVVMTVYGPEYVCPVDGATFYTPEAFMRHARIHGGVI